AVKPVALPQVEATKAFLPPQVCAMIDMQLVTGMRPGEVCQMRACDIDMSGKLWLYRPSQHKTQHHGHTREIWLGPKAQDIIKPYLKADLQACLFSPKDAESHRHAQARTHRRENQKPNERKTERTLKARFEKDTYCRGIAYACDKAFPAPEPLARRA